MSTITIEISAEQLRQLEAVAERFGIVPQELVRVSLDELLAGPDEEL